MEKKFTACNANECDLLVGVALFAPKMGRGLASLLVESLLKRVRDVAKCGCSTAGELMDEEDQ